MQIYNFASKFIPQPPELQPVRHLRRSEDHLRAQACCVAGELFESARGVDRSAGVVGRDGEEGDGVFGTCWKDDHNSVVRHQADMKAGRGDGEFGHEIAKGGMCERRSARVGFRGPEGGGVGSAETVEEGADAARAFDSFCDMLSERKFWRW